jgi:hypothetical protein
MVVAIVDHLHQVAALIGGPWSDDGFRWVIE